MEIGMGTTRMGENKQVGEFFGKPIIEDDNVKEIRLPKALIAVLDVELNLTSIVIEDKQEAKENVN